VEAPGGTGWNATDGRKPRCNAESRQYALDMQGGPRGSRRRSIRKPKNFSKILATDPKVSESLAVKGGQPVIRPKKITAVLP